LSARVSQKIISQQGGVESLSHFPCFGTLGKRFIHIEDVTTRLYEVRGTFVINSMAIDLVLLRLRVYYDVPTIQFQFVLGHGIVTVDDSITDANR